MSPRTLPSSLLVLVLALSMTAKSSGDDTQSGAGRETCSDRIRVVEDFSDDRLDPCTWVAMRENWGGKADGVDYNGGVVPENISVSKGKAHLRALGNFYSGAVRGFGSDGQARPHGRRTGAAIVSRQRFLGGRFEARVRIASMPGVCSAMWTFFYDAEPGKPVRNHEIDIEFPGREHIDAAPSFQHVAMTTWTGLQRGQFTTAFRPLRSADEEFHTLRFDWYPPSSISIGRVDFYIDDEMLYSTDENVPSEPAPLWLGVWFPQQWAGTPDFEEAEMVLDWVRIGPL